MTTPSQIVTVSIICLSVLFLHCWKVYESNVNLTELENNEWVRWILGWLSDVKSVNWSVNWSINQSEKLNDGL